MLKRNGYVSHLCNGKMVKRMSERKVAHPDEPGEPDGNEVVG